MRAHVCVCTAYSGEDRLVQPLALIRSWYHPMILILPQPIPIACTATSAARRNIILVFSELFGKLGKLGSPF